jgi:hypothetical protein
MVLFLPPVALMYSYTEETELHYQGGTEGEKSKTGHLTVTNTSSFDQ